MAMQYLQMNNRSGSRSTAGPYPDEFLTDRIGNWLTEVFQTRPSIYTKPYTIHLDQLLQEPVEAAWLVNTAFRSFEILIDQVKKEYPKHFMPSLRIPLECADRLEIYPLDPDTLRQQIDVHEPPSLYLVDRFDLWRRQPMEQYILPLDAKEFTGDDDIYVYYNATRGLEDIQNQWEYGRTIAADYLPRPRRASQEPLNVVELVTLP